MVSCLTLIRNSHALAGRQGEFNHTMCGLSISSEHAAPNLFADDADAVTCAHCRQALSSVGTSEMSNASAVDPKSLVIRLIAQLNANDVLGLAQSIGGELASEFATSRVRRLHEMFPGWKASIGELIAEGETVILHYHVACTDAFGLLGSGGPVTRSNQAIIVRVARQRVIGVKTIVDDFGVWSDISSPKYIRSNCACHPDAPSHFQCTT